MMKTIEYLRLFANTLKFGCGSVAVWVILFSSLTNAADTTTPAKLPDWRGIWAPVPGNFTGGSGGSTGALTAIGLKATNPYSYTPTYQAMFDRNMKGERGEAKAYDPTTNCEAPGMPRLLLIPYPVEFLITPEKVVVLHEYDGQTRRIYTDGRKHPPADELAESYNGHSIGHWEGDTLVVDTVGFKADTLLDRANVHSDALHMTERIRRISPDKLEDQVTLEDAKAFTKPWKSTFTWDHKTGEEWDLKEYVCQENNRNPPDPVTGKSMITPTAAGKP